MKHIFTSVCAIAATLFIATISSPVILAQAVGSKTDVTVANGKSLAHHELDVECSSHDGKTMVILTFRPGGKIPLASTKVEIFDKDGGESLVSFGAEIIQGARLAKFGEVPPGSSKAYFFVADKLVDHVEVTYIFQTDEGRPHIFTIKKGELRKLATLRNKN